MKGINHFKIRNNNKVIKFLNKVLLEFKKTLECIKSSKSYIKA